MKISFDITYDAGKLAKQMPKIIKDFLGNSALAFEVGSKKAIEAGNFDKIGEFTKIAREKGLSPNAKFKKTGSTKPLRHTDRLLKSIKALPKSQRLVFNEYGRYHLGKGTVFATGVQDIGNIKEKSGIAYKIAKNGFSIYNNIVGKSVPIRFWLKYDEETGESGLKIFKSRMKGAFRRQGGGMFI